MFLDKENYKCIKDHALSVFPEECCGLLARYNDKIFIFPSINCAEDKKNNFSISPYDYLSVAKNNEIIGFYHSHTQEEHSDTASQYDKLNSIGHQLPIVIYHALKDNFSIFDKNKYEYKYIGRKFKYGTNDCLSLVEDYYLTEFNIRLPHTERNDSTIKNNPFLMIENIDNYNFSILNNDRELKNGDIIITKSIYGPTHLMIYIGNNLVLHHRYNQYSTIEPYNMFYRKNTDRIVRHNTLC